MPAAFCFKKDTLTIFVSIVIIKSKAFARIYYLKPFSNTLKITISKYISNPAISGFF